MISPSLLASQVSASSAAAALSGTQHFSALSYVSRRYCSTTFNTNDNNNNQGRGQQQFVSPLTQAKENLDKVQSKLFCTNTKTHLEYLWNRSQGREAEYLKNFFYPSLQLVPNSNQTHSDRVRQLCAKFNVPEQSSEIHCSCCGRPVCKHFEGKMEIWKLEDELKIAEKEFERQQLLAKLPVEKATSLEAMTDAECRQAKKARFMFLFALSPGLFCAVFLLASATELTWSSCSQKQKAEDEKKKKKQEEEEEQKLSDKKTTSKFKKVRQTFTQILVDVLIVLTLVTGFTIYFAHLLLTSMASNIVLF